MTDVFLLAVGIDFHMFDVFLLRVEDFATVHRVAYEAVILDGVFPKFESGDRIYRQCGKDSTKGHT